MLSGAEIWATAVLIYAVAYWQLDGGGRTDVGWSHWRPMFVDYLYLSFTNCTALSQTDTMPLKPSMKLLMLVQGLTALVTIGVVVARAISLLG